MFILPPSQLLPPTPATPTSTNATYLLPQPQTYTMMLIKRATPNLMNRNYKREIQLHRVRQQE